MCGDGKVLQLSTSRLFPPTQHPTVQAFVGGDVLSFAPCPAVGEADKASGQGVICCARRLCSLFPQSQTRVLGAVLTHHRVYLPLH